MLLNTIFLLGEKYLCGEADIVGNFLRIRKNRDMKRAFKHLLLILSLCIGTNSVSFADEQTSEQKLERARQAYQAKDYELARQTFKPLAEAGHSNAQIYMGAVYDRGLGVERDIKQAIYWFEQSAEQGNVKLQYDLGVRYLNGKDVECDYGKAIYWWQKAAAAGAPQAQYNLALMYARGNGVAVDNDKAIELFRLAADRGLRDAQYALGLAYTKGQNLPLDYAEAYRLFKLAAKQDYPSAQYNLAALTESGEGTSADINEAIIWYRKAAKQGHELAQQRLTKLDVQPLLESQAITESQPGPDINTATVTIPAAMVIHDQGWIKNQPASNYTIQINFSHDKEKLISWLKSQQSLAPLAYFPQQQNGKVIYKAIYGSFIDQAAAQKALSEMPGKLVKLKPWLRRFSGVHGQIHDG